MIVVDVETTGLDPKKNSIVSIGAVDFYSPTNQFYQECRVWEGAEVTAEALQVNGFTEEQVRDPRKSSLEEVITAYSKWLEMFIDITSGGENPSFDRDFLLDSGKRYNINLGIGHRSVDLHTLCYTHQRQRGLNPPLNKRRTDLNTDKILQYVGLPAEPKPHHALMGAKMEAEAFSRFIYGRPLLKEFANHPVPDYLHSNILARS